MTPEERKAKIRAYKTEWARQNRERLRDRQRANGLASYYRHTEKRRALSNAWKANNPEKVKASRRAYRTANLETERANGRRWRAENQERARELGKRWAEANRDALRERAKLPENRNRARIYRKRRYATDVAFCIEVRLRTSLTQAVRRAKIKKSETFFTMIGCSIQELVKHLESLFLPDMTWENRKLWHIDHIRPVASFDLTNHEDQLACFHWTNLQPLWARDNQKKHKKWTPPTP